MKDITIKQEPEANTPLFREPRIVWEVNWTESKNGQRSRQSRQFKTLDEAADFVKSEA